MCIKSERWRETERLGEMQRGHPRREGKIAR